MFTDVVTIRVQAGKGGDGAVSWRHEKFVDRGGPDGGDGGDGGDIIVTADRNLDTLGHYRRGQVIKAEPGVDGAKQLKRGKSGEDTIIKVPVGTVVKAEGDIVADLVEPDQQEVVALGGKGGFGNAHFKSSRRQAPRVAEKGEPGDAMELNLELKLIANVGLVGLPNAGKSSFLAVVSDARPKIADYPFTTLEPHLGVADIDDSSLLIADIPGLIEGAHEGKGLGVEFLRHVERTQVLLHLVDISDDDYLDNYQTILKELASYRSDLSQRPTIVAATKIDLLEEKEVKQRIAALKKASQQTVLGISSLAHQQLEPLLRKLKVVVAKQKLAQEQAEGEREKPGIPVYELADKQRWEIRKTEAGFRISGPKIERFAIRTKFDDEFGRRRLRDIMKKMGIMHALKRAGAKDGDRITIGKQSFLL